MVATKTIQKRTWNSLMNCARMNCCLSELLGAVSTSGTVLWTGVFFWSCTPSRWQSKPTFPGNWKRWSWGPNGPMFSSGHTVLGPGEDRTNYMKCVCLYRPQVCLSKNTTTKTWVKPVWNCTLLWHFPVAGDWLISLLTHLSLRVMQLCKAHLSSRQRKFWFCPHGEQLGLDSRQPERGPACLDHTAPTEAKTHAYLLLHKLPFGS